MKKLTKGEKNQLHREDMMRRRKILEDKGFILFCSLKAGQNSSYSFDYENAKCPFGFDSYEEIVRWIEDRLERGTSVFRK